MAGPLSEADGLVPKLVETLANNNILIDQTLKTIHNGISHFAFPMGDAQSEAADGADEEYYNADPDEIDATNKKLCVNSGECAGELGTYYAFNLLSVPLRIFILHCFFVVVCGSGWVVMKGVSLILQKYHDIFTTPEEKDARDKINGLLAMFEGKDVKTTEGNVTVTKRVNGLIDLLIMIRLGLGPKVILPYALGFYICSIIVWCVVHVVLCYVPSPTVRSEFNTGDILTEVVGSSAGILYSIRIPWISSDGWRFIYSPWIVTPMASKDNRAICVAGFKPDGTGVAKRKIVEFEEAGVGEDKLGWCLAGGKCPLGGLEASATTGTTLLDDFNYYNVGKPSGTAGGMQYTAMSALDPFDKNCQPIKDIGNSVMNAGEEVGKAILSGLGIDL